MDDDLGIDDFTPAMLGGKLLPSFDQFGQEEESKESMPKMSLSGTPSLRKNSSSNPSFNTPTF